MPALQIGFFNDSLLFLFLSSPASTYRQGREGPSSAAPARTTQNIRRAERGSMSCLGRAAVPVKRVWRGLSARLRLRRATGKPSPSSYAPMDHRGSGDHPSDGEADVDVGAGLGRLRKDVRTCEYSDVHVMWEMLSSSSNAKSSSKPGGGAAAGKGSRKAMVGRKAAVAWSRLASYCCAL